MVVNMKHVKISVFASLSLSGKNHHYLDIYKLVKAEAGDEDTKQTIWGPAHAYTELAIFDRLAGPGQVYETNEDLKKV